MKSFYKVKFEYMHIKKLNYFEIADLEETCKTETKTSYIMAETPQQAENIVKHNYGKTTTIFETTKLQEKERTFENER